MEGNRFKPNSILLQENDGEEWKIGNKKRQTTVDSMFQKLNV